MKYTLVLLAAWLPLTVLTLASFVAAVRSPTSAPSGDDGSDVAAAEELVLRSKRAIEGDGPLVEKLWATELFDLESGPIPEAESETLRRVAAAWRDSQLARTFVARYQPIGELLGQPDPTGREDLQRRHEVLSGFLADARPEFNDKVRGAGAVLEQVQKRASQLEHKMDCLQWLEGVRLGVREAERALRDGRYEDCLARIAAQQTAPPPEAELRRQVTDELDRLAELQKTARYRWDYEKLERSIARAGVPLASGVPRGKSDPEVRRLLESFLEKYPEAPGGDSARHALVDQRRLELELESELAELESQQDIVRVIRDGAQLVRRASEVLKEGTDRQFYIQRVGEIARARLRGPEALPAMDDAPEDLSGKQEAVSNAGQRFIGVFYLPAGTTQYRFWRDQQDRQSRPRGDAQLAVNTLAQQPSTPRYVEWAKEYNSRVRDLLEGGGTIEEWEQFAQWCEETQTALEQYRQRWGLTEPYDRDRAQWSFRGPAAVARKTIASRDDFQDVLGR